jgi:hypothetical protein
MSGLRPAWPGVRQLRRLAGPVRSWPVLPRHDRDRQVLSRAEPGSRVRAGRSRRAVCLLRMRYAEYMRFARLLLS